MAKGFGSTKVPPTRNATKFMRAFAQCLAKAKGDKQKINQFLQKNCHQLNDDLLAALPHLLPKLAVDPMFGDRENVARLLCNLGFHLIEFPLGDRACNLEIAIAALQAANKVLTHKAHPENWATVQLNLGNAYVLRIQGDRAASLEQSIAAYELALQVFTRDAFPENWAKVQLNLGSAYQNRIRGDRASSLEQSIAAYELALQVFTRDAFPEDWAKVQLNLGNAYQNRIRGDRASSLEQSIAAYELALQVFTRDAFPENWATVQLNLGSAYDARIRGDRADNLEKSIAALELALLVRTQEALPEDWARTQNNLGFAYGDRIKGNRADNLEEAISRFEKALDIYTRDAFPEDWARAQQNLGNTYRERLKGNPLENLATALHYYQQAEQVFTQTAFPLPWARNQSEWAAALMKRWGLTGDLQDGETAIRMLRGALTEAVPGSPDFIDAQYRLGNALSRRFEHSQETADLEQALAAYKAALGAINPEHYDRAKIWQALPTTQSILGSRLVRAGEWQEGLEILLNSVRLLREGDDSQAHANALYQTAVAHETLSDWDNARLYYRDALRLYARLEDSVGIAKSRYGLGSALASQGYFKKGMAELSQARDLYIELGKTQAATTVEGLLTTAQRAEQQLQTQMQDVMP
jgi:tetratricopeptide (TPR) repeat protein